MQPPNNTSTSTLALNCRKCTVELTLISTSCGKNIGTTRQLDDTSTTSSRCRQPRSNTFRDEIGRSPRAPTSTRKMQTQLLSAQDIAARHRHLRQLWTSRNHRTLSHQLFAERNCSSCQEYLRPTEDQLHITDNSTSGSGPGSTPSPDSPTVVRVNHGSEASRRTQLIGTRR